MFQPLSFTVSSLNIVISSRACMNLWFSFVIIFSCPRLYYRIRATTMIISGQRFTAFCIMNLFASRCGSQFFNLEVSSLALTGRGTSHAGFGFFLNWTLLDAFSDRYLSLCGCTQKKKSDLSSTRVRSAKLAVAGELLIFRAPERGSSRGWKY